MSVTEAEEAAMHRALALAETVRGRTSPNPPVGAVLLTPTGELAGEGATAPAGGPHAEIVALTAGRNVALLAEQSLAWRPRTAVIEDESLLPELRQRLNGSGSARGCAGAAMSGHSSSSSDNRYAAPAARSRSP